MVSSCKQLTALNLSCCKITDAAVVALASASKNLTCCNITDTAVVLAVALRGASSSQRSTAGCKQLATLDLTCCDNITDAAVKAVASGCKQLAALNLMSCRKITDAAQ